MKFIKLEDRSMPVFFGVVNGSVIMPDDSSHPRPFGDFDAAHYSASDGEVFVFGADQGGGPRVHVYEGTTSIGDAFAYESTFRDGVLVAYENGVVVTGTNAGGGPVVAVFDKNMNQISRFFAYEPEFRGGVSVAIVDGVIYTVPGVGGGPVVKAFTIMGEPISARYGADPSRRDGWDIIPGDATADGIDDLTLSNRKGQLSIIDGATGFRGDFNTPAGWVWVGYEGQSLIVGKPGSYERQRLLHTWFPTQIGFEFVDGAAGNQNPPPTAGTRPGVYRPQTTSFVPPDFTDMETFLNPSDSVGATNTGTGSGYVGMYTTTNQLKALTASHVVRRSPFWGLDQVTNLTSPGRLDGTPVDVGTPFSISTIIPNVPYVVDAAAFTPLPGVTITNSMSFAGESLRLTGVRDNPVIGEGWTAVGRSLFVGVGYYDGSQTQDVSIKWPSNEFATVTGQYVATAGIVRLAVPGFSGGIVFHGEFVGDNDYAIELVGMTVAGNATTVFVTPHRSIESNMNLTWRP